MTCTLTALHESTSTKSLLCFHEVFAQQVARTPAAPALAEDNHVLSYRGLDILANRLAWVLRACGVGPNKVVGVAIHQGMYRLETIVTLLAIHKAGGAYAILDAFYPPTQIAWMVADAQVSVIVAMHHSLLELTTGVSTPLQVLCLDDPELQRHIDSKPSTLPPSGVVPQDLAYVIYTSGTTGNPKGVLCTHEHLGPLVAYQRDFYKVGPGDRLSQLYALRFDGSVFEIVMPLGNGATLCLPPTEALHPGPQTVAWLAREHVSFACFTPSFLAALPDAELPELASILVAGEACPATLVRQHQKRGRRVYGAYGLSETGICVMSSLCRDDEREAPLGHRLPYADLMLLGKDGLEVPPGVVGEIVVSFPLARGYTDPELTRQRFLRQGSTRVLHTGDHAWQDDDGTYVFAGRVDDQHKVQGGILVNFAGVEQAIRDYPTGAVRACKVLLLEEKWPVAYVVFHTPGQVPTRDLLQYLQEHLPAPSVPRYYVEMAALPLTVNGKAASDPALYPKPTVEEIAAQMEGTRVPSTREEIALATLVTRLKSNPFSAPPDPTGIDMSKVPEDLGIDSLLMGEFEVAIIEQWHTSLTEEQAGWPLYRLAAFLAERTASVPVQEAP